MKKIKYPATQIVHWPSGPVNCCDDHGRALLALSTMLGSHIVATKLTEPAECSNCINENKSSV